MKLHLLVVVVEGALLVLTMISVAKVLLTIVSSLVMGYDGNYASAIDDMIIENLGGHCALDSAKITHVYHIGFSGSYGRSNNQIITILHAVDMALDYNGDFPNNHAVVAVSNWAFDILKAIFFNGSDPAAFPLQLEQLRPVILVHEDRLESLGLGKLENKTHIYLSAKDTYYYLKRNQKRLTPNIMENRRRTVLGSLLQHGVAEQNLLLYNVVRDHIGKISVRNNKNERVEYVTIHSRWLEGSCETRIGSHLPKDECWMTPTYIKNIIGGAIDKPIVLIGDGQNKEVIENLKNDLDIGPALIIPQDIVPDDADFSFWPQPWSDMFIAIMSETFIGTRVSTFATIVGIFRVIRGSDPASNFIYTSQESSPLNGQKNIEICEDCLFLCDKDQSHLCGHNVVYS